MTHGISRRDLLRAGGLGVGGALVLGGCGGAGAGDSTELEFAWWGSPERHQNTRAALKAYAAKHKDVSVSPQFGGWDGYWEKLATQTAGGNLPDVIQMDYAYITEYARRESLLALDDLVPDPLSLPGFSKAELVGGRIGGNLYGVNFGVNSTSLILDLTQFEQAGIGVPQGRMTWDDFAAVTQEASRKSPDGVYGTMDGGQEASAFEAWLLSRGKALATEKGEIGYDEQDLTEWWEYWDELRRSGAAVPADLQATDLGDVQDSLVARGKSFVDFAWSNQLTAYQAVTDHDVDIHTYPEGEAGSPPSWYLKPSMLLSVSAQTEQQEAALALVEALVADPDVAGALGSERGIPPCDRVREAVAADASDTEKRVDEFVAEVTKTAGPLPPPQPLGAGEVNNELLVKMNQEVAFGRMTVGAAVDRFFQDASRAVE
jgi:multiple sugar transport system substrate-binding protein